MWEAFSSIIHHRLTALKAPRHVNLLTKLALYSLRSLKRRDLLPFRWPLMHFLSFYPVRDEALSKSGVWCDKVWRWVKLSLWVFAALHVKLVKISTASLCEPSHRHNAYITCLSLLFGLLDCLKSCIFECWLRFQIITFFTVWEMLFSPRVSSL